MAFPYTPEEAVTWACEERLDPAIERKAKASRDAEITKTTKKKAEWADWPWYEKLLALAVALFLFFPLIPLIPLFLILPLITDLLFGEGNSENIPIPRGRGGG